MDIRCTRDGRAVVIHDASTRRTTGVRRRVARSTLAALQTLDAGSFKDAHWERERIPSLREVLAVLPPGKRLIIELKAGPEILAPLAADLAAAAHVEPAQIVLIAFNRELARLAKERLPHLTLLWIGDPRRRRLGAGFRPANGVRRMATTARSLGLDGLDLRAHRCLTAALVEEIHALGLQLFVWTVNRPRTAERLLRAGVDGLTTDRPDVMLKVRTGIQAAKLPSSTR